MHVLLLMFAASGVAGMPTDPVPKDSLVESLRSTYAAYDDYTTTFEVLIHPTTASDAPAPIEHEWSGRRRYEITISKGRLRIDVRGRDRRPNGATESFTSLYTWDGRRFSSRLDNEPAVGIDDRVNLPTAMRAIFPMIMRADAEAIPGLIRPAEAIEAGVPLAQQRDEDGRLRYRFYWPGAGDDANATLLERTFLVDSLHREGPRVVEYHKVLYGGGPEGRRTIRRREVQRYGPWKRYGDMRLPSGAVRTVEVMGGQDSRTQTIVVRRLDAMRLDEEPDPSVFHIEPQDGDTVADARRSVAYEIGGTILWLDGVAYRLPEPLAEPPRARLASILRTATVIDHVPGAGESRASVPRPRVDSSSERLVASPLFAAGLVGGTGGLVLIAFGLRRKGRS